jgi:DNA-binding transcriptional regulator LsrR (DeoR family)
MNTKFDISLMVKVAQMYYTEGMKQEEIAGHLSISRSLISMILTEAKEAGIVEIKIRNPLVNNDELSNTFKTLFGLMDCVIIPTAVQDSGTLRRLIAQRAVEVFNSEVSNASMVGLAWGRTCYQFVDSYKADREWKDIGIVPLIGGSNQTAGYFQVNEMVRQLAEKMSGQPNFIYAPALTESVEEKELYLQSSSMQGIIEKWSALDIIVSGVGTLPGITDNERETYIGEYEIYKQLEESHAVGDICARYFTVKGEFIRDDYYNRVIGIPIESMQKARKTICFACGQEKVQSILGALRTKMISIFICDEQTAKAVLKYMEQA